MADFDSTERTAAVDAGNDLQTQLTDIIAHIPAAGPGGPPNWTVVQLLLKIKGFKAAVATWMDSVVADVQD